MAVRLWSASILGVVLAGAAQPAAAAPPPVRPGAPISSHAMVHTCCTPAAMKERIFSESKAMGARFIRVDVELSGIFASEAGAPDWRRLDEVLELSRRHELPALGILLSPPGWLAPHEAQEFGRLAGLVAAHARHTITRWEILNEPDGAWAFQGTPEEYAHLLRASYDAIGAAVPEAEVAMGGVMTPEDPGWIERVLATPGADAARAFDIANLHLRGHERGLPGRLAAWRDLLAARGFRGPVWVTEHGYPADPAYQTDPAFRGGESAQAAFLTESVLSLAEAGADEVFVTLRDNLDGGFASEGVVGIDDQAPHLARRKPAFAAVRRLVDRWGELMSARSEQRAAEDAAGVEGEQVAAYRLQAAGYRAAALAARAKLTRVRARYRRARYERARARLVRDVTRATRRLRRRQDQVAWARALAGIHSFRAALHAQHARDLANFVAGG
ncbi:MAG: hypothetical protein ACRDN8_11000 [Thermoleophilaceae bacterium]